VSIDAIFTVEIAIHAVHYVDFDGLCNTLVRQYTLRLLLTCLDSVAETPGQGRIQPVSLGGGRFQQYVAVKSHYGFTTVREMK